MDTGAFEENLRKRGIVLKVFDTKEDAASYLTQTIKGKTVGFGGSMTLEEMGLYEKLKPENTLYWHWRQQMSTSRRSTVSQRRASSSTLTAAATASLPR